MLRSRDQLALAHGACVVVELADRGAALTRLAPEEQRRALALADARQLGYVAGRTALHLALASDAAIPSDDRGAPVLPAGWVGSVSHKGAWAAALVAPAGQGQIGVDLERAAPPRTDIARRILTARELTALPDRGPAVTLRFAIKEAIYKALDPYVRRYVGFTEVELTFAGDAVAVATALPFEIAATFCAHGDHWLATAHVRSRDA